MLTQPSVHGLRDFSLTTNFRSIFTMFPPKLFPDIEPEPGERLNTEMAISESYSSRNITIPIHVRRGIHDGPRVFVTAALHGDELNGTGAIRHLLSDASWELHSGTLVLVPVLNILGYERHSRYLPDRRDLNRCFPGSKTGSMSSRMARTIFDQLIEPCDFGIDLHTAAVRRTNYPNARADLSNPKCAEMAEAFGAGIILDAPGPEGSLRRSATDRGVPTIVVEGGEVWRMESAVIDCMTRGVLNVLRKLEMVDGEIDVPIKQTVISHTKWIRAERGGLMQMHVAPGETVKKDQPLATNCSLLNEGQNQLLAPFSGVVLGASTLPSVKPGEPVVHIGKLGTRKQTNAYEKRSENDSVQQDAIEQFSSSVHVIAPESINTDETDS